MIDPDEMLSELRLLCKGAVKEGNLDARQLALKIQELDKWLTGKGFPPKDWSAWH